MVLEQLDRISDAINCYLHALSLDVRASAAYYQLACCYAKQNKVYWAITFIEKAIDLNPESYLKLAIEDSIWFEYRQQAGFMKLIHKKSNNSLVKDWRK